LAATTVSVKGATGASIGDDTGTWEFDGLGALSETGMTTVSITPSSTVDVDAGGAVTIDSSAAAISVGGDSVAQKISIGGDTSTRTEVELNAILVDINAGASGVKIDAGATSNFTTSAGDIDINAAANLDLDGATVDIESAAALSLQAAAASDFTTSAGALTLDGQTGINIQENGTTIISVDDSRDIVVGNATNAETIRIGHSTSEVTVGDNLTVTGNLNVAGTETIVDSNVVNISDNIIQVNTGGAKRKGGLQVIDTDGDQTGSVVWDSDGNYFEVGLSGSEYRLPELASTTELSGNNNKVLISDGARIDASATITDDGTTVDISNRVDAQASLQVTGSLYVSAGASVASSLASLVSFRNNGSTQLGYLASANTSAVTTGLVGYNASTGNLTVSSVIDGGSF
jgi:hypothetical protein